MHEMSEVIDYKVKGLCFWYEMTSLNRFDIDIYRLGMMFDSIRYSYSSQDCIAVRKPQYNKEAENQGEN